MYLWIVYLCLSLWLMFCIVIYQLMLAFPIRQRAFLFQWTVHLWVSSARHSICWVECLCTFPKVEGVSKIWGLVYSSPRTGRKTPIHSQTHYWIKDTMDAFKYLKSFLLKNEQHCISLCDYKSHVRSYREIDFSLREIRATNTAKGEIGCC